MAWHAAIRYDRRDFRGFHMMRFAIACAALFAVAAISPAQAEVTIKAFYGEWVGTAVSETEASVTFALTVRDIGVTVKPTDGGGFALTWSTVQRQKGDPNKPTEELKSTTVEFIPAGAANLWRAKDPADPVNGGTLYWADLEGQTLTVNGFAVDDRGRAEIQVYKRTLTLNGMELDFVRVVDGQVVRRASGKLTKFSN